MKNMYKSLLIPWCLGFIIVFTHNSAMHLCKIGEGVKFEEKLLLLVHVWLVVQLCLGY